MIRFQIHKPDTEPVFTDWMEETLGDLGRQTAAQQVAELRREHPDAAISVERSSIIPRRKQMFVRFKISETGNQTLYSVVFPIAEKEQRLTEFKEKYPDAIISPEEREI